MEIGVSANKVLHIVNISFLDSLECLGLNY